MEDIADGLMRPILKLLAAVLRVMWFLISEILGEILLWGVGWCFWRAISFGRYPKQGISEADQASVATEVIVQITGLILLVALSYWVFNVLGA